MTIHKKASSFSDLSSSSGFGVVSPNSLFNNNGFCDNIPNNSPVPVVGNSNNDVFGNPLTQDNEPQEDEPEIYGLKGNVFRLSSGSIMECTEGSDLDCRDLDPGAVLLTKEEVQQLNAKESNKYDYLINEKHTEMFGNRNGNRNNGNGFNNDSLFGNNNSFNSNLNNKFFNNNNSLFAGNKDLLPTMEDILSDRASIESGFNNGFNNNGFNNNTDFFKNVTLESLLSNNFPKSNNTPEKSWLDTCFTYDTPNRDHRPGHVCPGTV